MSDTEDEVREISPFDVRNMEKSYTALHIGPPKSGKSFNIKSLAYLTHYNYPVGQVTCGTEATQGGFAPMFGDLFTSEKFDEEIQERASARQVKAIRAKCPNFYAFHVVDDCGYNKKNLKNTNVIEAIKNGTQWLKRAYHVGIHSPKEVHDELTGFNYIFVYNQKDDTLRRLLWRLYFKVYLPNFKDFHQLMNDMFDNKFGALVIDVKKQSSKLEECVTIFRPPYWTWPNSDDPKAPRPYPEGWRFGCQQFKDWNDARVNKNYVPDFISKLG